MGQNNAVVPIAPANPTPPGYGSGIPAERPFRSLSYPDIDYTVMRPATLPPSPFTNPPSTDATSYIGRSGREESQSLPGIPDAERPDGQCGRLW